MVDAMLDPDRGSFDKWQMYRVLLGQDIGPCQLPATFPWNPALLPRHLRRFQSVYVKPLDAWGGRGISLVESAGALPGTLRWTEGGRTRAFASLPQLGILLASVYPPYGAIVQQAAPLAHCDGSVFDVRVLMQRLPDDRWTLGGMVARVGGKDSIVSNVATSQGSVRTVEDALASALPRRLRTRDRTERIKLLLTAASHRVCRVLDPYRHFTEVGLDFGVDASGGLWLIEVNTDDALGGPSHALFAQLPDRRVYDQIEARRQAYDKATMRMVLKAMGLEETPSGE